MFLVSLRPSFSDEGTFSVRALGKPWKQLIDVRENSGVNREQKKKKNPSIACVSGNRRKSEGREKSSN